MSGSLDLCAHNDARSVDRGTGPRLDRRGLEWWPCGVARFAITIPPSDNCVGQIGIQFESRPAPRPGLLLGRPQRTRNRHRHRSTQSRHRVGISITTSSESTSLPTSPTRHHKGSQSVAGSNEKVCCASCQCRLAHKHTPGLHTASGEPSERYVLRSVAALFTRRR
jgi:hypothetical protein